MTEASGTEGAQRCPFCGSADTELVAPWGGQLITSAMRCRACHSHFEALREIFRSAPTEAPTEVPREGP